MARGTMYKIEILNWEKYNQKAKKNHPCIMLSKRFLDDAKIQRLPAGGKLLYLGLLLRRGEVESTFVEATHEDLVRFAGGSGQVVQRLLTQLESFQLLKYEKMAPNIIEKNIKEDKRIEKKSAGVEKPKSKSNPLNSEIWEAYRSSYFNRYKVNPVRNAKVNSNISQLASRLGPEAIEIVRFYLSHNDAFYLKNMHDIGHCLANAESLRTQFLKGRAITSVHVKNFEKNLNQVELIREAEKGGF